MDLEPELRDRLARLAAFFDLDRLAETPCRTQDISRYYRVSRYAYSRYSRGSNAIHLGLSETDEFRAEDLSGQVSIVETWLPPGAGTVIELATGRGYNAIRLARRHPAIDVHGIDLSPAQLDYARRDGANIANFRAAEGDFHDLSRFGESTVDLIFVVEALCHSGEPARVMAEVARILRPGGIFVVFDGYSGDAPMSRPTRRAVRLLARGMAVPDFAPYGSFRESMIEQPFEIVTEENLSPRVRPTLKRLESKANWFTANPLRARLMRFLLPQPLVANAVSGYLFPVLLDMGAFQYRLTVVRRLSD